MINPRSVRTAFGCYTSEHVDNKEPKAALHIVGHNVHTDLGTARIKDNTVNTLCLKWHWVFLINETCAATVTIHVWLTRRSCKK